MEHSRLPWASIGVMIFTSKPSVMEQDNICCTSSTNSLERTEQEANAQFIVKACNAHEELVEVLKKNIHHSYLDKKAL